jgi:hypothetical protein
VLRSAVLRLVEQMFCERFEAEPHVPRELEHRQAETDRPNPGQHRMLEQPLIDSRELRLPADAFFVIGPNAHGSPGRREAGKLPILHEQLPEVAF